MAPRVVSRSAVFSLNSRMSSANFRLLIRSPDIVTTVSLLSVTLAVIPSRKIDGQFQDKNSHIVDFLLEYTLYIYKWCYTYMNFTNIVLYGKVIVFKSTCWCCVWEYILSNIMLYIHSIHDWHMLTIWKQQSTQKTLDSMVSKINAKSLHRILEPNTHSCP